jgi:hypothetical protein
MTSYATLLSSARIGRELWQGFVQSVGTELIDKPHNPYDGRLCREQGKIWLGMDNGIIEDIDPDDSQLIHLLGGEPQTVIVMEIGSTPGSRELALEFACRFADRWPCVVEAEHWRYSSRELFALYRDGRPFLTSEG